MGYAFGKFVLEPDLHELKADGATISVEPQVFALILYLIENRNRVVSKEELIETIWDGRFVSDSAVSSRIKSARQALGDNGREQAVIKTVHGKGFRFVAVIDEPTHEPQTTPDTLSKPGQTGPSSTTDQGSERSNRRLLLVAAAALIGLTVALLGVLWGGRSNAYTDQIRFAVLPVANATGDASLNWTELGLMSLVQHNLDRQTNTATVSAGAVMSLIDDREGSASGELVLDSTLRERLVRSYGASHIVLSRLSGPEGDRQLDYVVVVSGESGEQKTLVGSDPILLARDMSRDLGALASGARGLTSVDRSISDDPFVLEAYARGRALQLEGRAEESLNLFDVAAQQEPGNLWLRYEAALSTRMMGEAGASIEALLGLLGEAEAAGDVEIHLAILNALGVAEMRRRNNEAAIAYLEQALPMAEARGDHDAIASVLTNLGINTRILKQYAQSERYLSRAISAYADAGRPPSINVLNSLAVLKLDTGELVAAEPYLQDALTGTRALGNKRAEAVILHNLGDLAEMLGQWDLAEERYLASLALREEVNDGLGLVSSRSALANLSLKKGQPDRAEFFAAGLLDVARRGSSDEAMALGFLGEAARLRGAYLEAEDFHQQARAVFLERETRRGVLWQDLKLAVTRYASGDAFEAVVESLDRVVDEAASEPLPSLEMETRLALATMFERRGEFDRAVESAEPAYTIAEDLPSPEFKGLIAARLGRLAWLEGDDAAAATYLGLATSNHADHFETHLLTALRAHRAGDAGAALASQTEAKTRAGALWRPEFDQYFARPIR